MNFKKGDTVRLKSGGPLMTVVETKGNQLLCQWFDKNEALQSRLFDVESLDNESE
jgi:uncharacterized protein YodC (DUF2158 family)